MVPILLHDLSLAIFTVMLVYGFSFVLRSYKEKYNRLLCLLCVSNGVWNLTLSMIHMGATQANFHFWRILGNAAYLIYLISWVMTIYRNGRLKLRCARPVFWLTAALALATCIAQLFSKEELVLKPEGNVMLYHNGLGFYLMETSFLLISVLALAVTVLALLKAQSKSQRVSLSFFAGGTLMQIVLVTLRFFGGNRMEGPHKLLPIVTALTLLLVLFLVHRLQALRMDAAVFAPQMMECIDLSVIALTMENEVVLANQAAKAFFREHGQSDILHKEIQALMDSNEVTPLSLESLEEEKKQFRVLLKDGTACNLNIHLPKDSFGEVIGRVITIADMTEQISFVENLKRAREEAVAANEAKSFFLANMSHEIRTPMNAIVGITELILREKISPMIRENATAIRHAGNSLLGIINDILDLSKIESGKMEVNEASYSTISIIADIVNMVNIRLGDKGVDFVVDVDSSLPDSLMGDELRVKQILINVLNNAVKFTQEGYIYLTLLYDEMDSGSFLRILVRDTGLGMRKEEMEKLFTAFSRLDTRKNRNVEGTGLGLTITQQFVKLMNGSIDVESEYGRGSTFVLNIPQERTSDLPIAQVQDPESKKVIVFETNEVFTLSYMHSFQNLNVDATFCHTVSLFYDHMLQCKYQYIFVSLSSLPRIEPIIESLNPTATVVLMLNRRQQSPGGKYKSFHLPMYCLHIAAILNDDEITGHFRAKAEDVTTFIAPTAEILIVDDNHVNLKVAIGLMKPYEMKIITATSASEAVAIIKTQKLDLVFMDHMMPGTDGVDATIMIRKMPEDYYKELPIIALSANAVTGAREMFRDAGLNDFLAKPIEVSKLNQILRKWIPSDKQITTSKVLQTVNEGALSELGIEGVNISLGLAAIGGDTDAYLEVLGIFLRETRPKLIQLQEFLDQQDVQRFTIEVHAIKGSCANIGAYEASMKARQLEDAGKKENLEYIRERMPAFRQIMLLLLEQVEKALAQLEESSAPDKQIGNILELQGQVEKLCEALDTLNLSAAEALFTEMNNCQWAPQLALCLKEMGEAMSMFDYDEAMAQLGLLKQLIQETVGA